jgi:hypothetical protein
MAGQVVLVAATSILLAAAAPMPATLGPPATGSMYNGNNVHPPNLGPSGPQAPATGAPPSTETDGQGATGANIQGGRGAAQGGGG